MHWPRLRVDLSILMASSNVLASGLARATITPTIQMLLYWPQIELISLQLFGDTAAVYSRVQFGRPNYPSHALHRMPTTSLSLLRLPQQLPRRRPPPQYQPQLLHLSRAIPPITISSIMAWHYGRFIMGHSMRIPKRWSRQTQTLGWHYSTLATRISRSKLT